MHGELSDEGFLRDFEIMSSFGATSHGGVDRQAATPADIEQRRWFASLLSSLGLTVEYDRIGNQFGLLELVPDAPYVVVGSHMDSQPTAGKYDGAYGVLAAAYAVARAAMRLREDASWSPRYNLAVVNWFNEEGSRFAPSMMGSAVFTGKLALEDALRISDRNGVTVQQALEATEFLGTGDGPAPAFCAEIHIEQGRELENSSTQIGLVTASWAASKYVIEVNGSQAHSGATVMADRHDALFGAAQIVVAARRLADRFPGVLHTAIGQLDVYPNSPVVVASHVKLLLDLRSPDAAVLAEARSLLVDHFAEIEVDARVTIESTLSHSWDVNPYQPVGVELSRLAAQRLGLAHREIMTVAGHDSINMKDIVPTVMLFVPSVDGISHNEGEYTEDADLLAGLSVLTEVTAQLSVGAIDGSGAPSIATEPSISR
jgi:beta-ureidopropionase / N-carbamoyl-L-amino-acid hydrolase